MFYSPDHPLHAPLQFFIFTFLLCGALALLTNFGPTVQEATAYPAEVNQLPRTELSIQQPLPLPQLDLRAGQPVSEDACQAASARIDALRAEILQLNLRLEAFEAAGRAIGNSDNWIPKGGLPDQTTPVPAPAPEPPHLETTRPARTAGLPMREMWTGLGVCTALFLFILFQILRINQFERNNR